MKYHCTIFSGHWDTYKDRLASAVLISTVASIACWVKYTSKMFKKV